MAVVGEHDGPAVRVPAGLALVVDMQRVLPRPRRPLVDAKDGEVDIEVPVPGVGHGDTAAVGHVKGEVAGESDVGGLEFASLTQGSRESLYDWHAQTNSARNII